MWYRPFNIDVLLEPLAAFQTPRVEKDGLTSGLSVRRYAPEDVGGTVELASQIFAHHRSARSQRPVDRADAFAPEGTPRYAEESDRSELASEVGRGRHLGECVFLIVRSDRNVHTVIDVKPDNSQNPSFSTPRGIRLSDKLRRAQHSSADDREP